MESAKLTWLCREFVRENGGRSGRSDEEVSANIIVRSESSGFVIRVSGTMLLEKRMDEDEANAGELRQPGSALIHFSVLGYCLDLHCVLCTVSKEVSCCCRGLSSLDWPLIDDNAAVDMVP